MADVYQELLTRLVYGVDQSSRSQVLNSIKAMGDNLQNATKGVGEIKPKLNKPAMNEVTKQVGTWSQKLQNMVNVGLATPLITHNISKIVNMFKPLIAQRADLETFRLSFETLTGTAEEGAKALQNALNFKANSNYSLQSINEATQSLLQFGMNAGEANLMLGTLGDLALGDSSKLQTLSKIMGKVYAKGEADVEMKQVLKTTGINMKELFKGMAKYKNFDFEDGTITFAMMMEGIDRARQEGGRFYKGMERAGSTLQAKWDDLFESFQLGASKLIDPLIPAFKKWIDQIKQIDLSNLQAKISAIVNEIAKFDFSQLQWLVGVLHTTTNMLFWILKQVHAIGKYVTSNWITGFFALLPIFTVIALSIFRYIKSLTWVVALVGKVTTGWRTAVGSMKLANREMQSYLWNIRKAEGGMLAMNQATKSLHLGMANIKGFMGGLGKAINAAFGPLGWALLAIEGIAYGTSKLMGHLKEKDDEKAVERMKKSSYYSKVSSLGADMSINLGLQKDNAIKIEKLRKDANNATGDQQKYFLNEIDEHLAKLETLGEAYEELKIKREDALIGNRSGYLQSLQGSIAGGGQGEIKKQVDRMLNEFDAKELEVSAMVGNAKMKGEAVTQNFRNTVKIENKTNINANTYNNNSQKYDFETLRKIVKEMNKYGSKRNLELLGMAVG